MASNKKSNNYFVYKTKIMTSVRWDFPVPSFSKPRTFEFLNRIIKLAIYLLVSLKIASRMSEYLLYKLYLTKYIFNQNLNIYRLQYCYSTP